jgi:hypothetical protein
MSHERAYQLEAQHQQNKQNAHDLPCAALRQPTFHPGEDHLHEQ